ncbi:uncharacterized protein LOC111328153 [Stylophora pistillata]|uniref:uncharacterized protein LOC111328153 n=1 Tax=Stylophora pistillata TaxID=50429 RepID=UPI000C04E35F|nr:uncharacterized protein LOC111328153 [Stylophora pistillata]
MTRRLCSNRADDNQSRWRILLMSMDLGKKQKSKENQTEKDEWIGTRAGTRESKREETRAATSEIHSRDTLRLPDICQTTTGGTYYQLIPPKQKPLHQWRDLKNRIRHDYNLVPLPYKNVHIVNR